LGNSFKKKGAYRERTSPGKPGGAEKKRKLVQGRATESFLTNNAGTEGEEIEAEPICGTDGDLEQILKFRNRANQDCQTERRQDGSIGKKEKENAREMIRKGRELSGERAPRREKDDYKKPETEVEGAKGGKFLRAGGKKEVQVADNRRN